MPRLRFLLDYYTIKRAERYADPGIHSTNAWRRTITGARVMFMSFLPFFVLILIARIVEGPVYHDRGDTTNLDLLAVVYPVGTIMFGAILGLGDPLLRRRITAIPLGIVAILPWVAAMGACLDRGHQKAARATAHDRHRHRHGPHHRPGEEETTGRPSRSLDAAPPRS